MTSLLDRFPKACGLRHVGNKIREKSGKCWQVHDVAVLRRALDIHDGASTSAVRV